jgi:hypothetical protein
MRKIRIIMITLSMLLAMAVTASAYHHNDDDQPPPHRNSHYDDHYDHHDNHHDDWRHEYREDHYSDRSLPFRWHDHRDYMEKHYRLERIDDRGWHDRFPGEHAYRWHSNSGFWHHGDHVTDAVLFFDNDGRLISIGYRSNGVFIHFREDNRFSECHDEFFFSWWGR